MLSRARTSSLRIVVWSTRSLFIVALAAGCALFRADVGSRHTGDQGAPAAATASLRAAMDVARYAVHQPDGVRTDYYANNPAQGYQAQFSPAGLEVAPKRIADGDQPWRVGLSLSALARGDRRLPIGAGRVTASGPRVAVTRTAGAIDVHEWFFNKRTGLEHGATLSARPLAGNDAPLRLQLAVSGTLAARVSDARDAVRLVDVSGHAALTYDRLHVTDRTGRTLASHFEVADGAVNIVVADADAAYPIVIDPTLTQQAYVKASNTAVQDLFGTAVAISGNTAVIGATQEDSIATGVNGNEADNTSSNSGAAYVFVQTNGVWSQQAYLKASNTGAGDNFGGSVAISGDTIVIGVVGEDGSSFGVNGADNNSAAQAGAAYVFVRNGTAWSQQAYLKSSNRTGQGGGDQFGISVAVSGDTIAVGAWGEDGNASGVNGTNTGFLVGSGAVYVFTRSGTAWTQQAYIKASNPGAQVSPFGDEFGYSVGLDGDTLIVGAASPYGSEDSSATGVNGDQNDNSALESGAAYVFTRSGATWSQQAYLKASNTGAGDAFGQSVAISGDTVVVGAYREDSSATGIDGDQSDDSAANSGAAYVFVRNSTTWSQQAYLKASNTGANDQFGFSVAVSGDIVVVGAPTESSNATGINGDQSNNLAAQSGAAYVFARSGTTWTQQSYLKGWNTGAGDQFGWSVSASDSILVGARLEASDVTGVNSASADNNLASQAGAAYIFAIQANQAPVADAGADQFVSATSATGATVGLTGAASSDPDGDTLTYSWTNDFNGTVLTGAAPSITVPFGTHTFTLTVTDGSLTSTDTVVVTVADVFAISTTTPPLVGATYFRNQVVPAEYTCSDTANLMASCTANMANLDTATAGTKTFSVTATNTLGDTSSQSRTYDVLPQAAQTIIFPAPAATGYGDSVTLGATATSGLAVSYASNTPAVCSVTGSIASTLAAGTCSITASQNGDANWLAAAPATQTFTVLTRPVTATLTANSKVYDGTTAEPDLSLSCALSGVLAADTGNVVCTPGGGAFDNATVGSPRVVTATLTLSGSSAANYTLGAAGTAILSASATNSPTSTTATAVYGQAGSFTTVTANTGGISADSIASARGVAADAAGNIYVADRDNNRVLFFPFGQTTATRVYGQGGSFTTGTANNGGVSAGSFQTPVRVAVDSTGLYVADAGNHRVLFFPGTSTTATRVYGQGGSFTSNTANNGGVSADSLNSPRGLTIDPAGNLYVADALNNRVLFFPNGSTTATRVYGQDGIFTTNLVNNTAGVAGVVSASSLSAPNGIRLDASGNAYLADPGNNRVLVFPAGQTTATAVYGQGGSFATGTANTGGVSATSLSNPANLALDGGNNLYVADTNNNRVLFFPANQTSATVVYGQAGSFATNIANNGGVSATSLRGPNSIDLDFAGNIYVSDISNNRVLRFNGSAPAITPAALVVTASSGTKTYGSSFAVAPGYSGFVNGETSAVLSSPATCTSPGAAVSAGAGTYATTCSGAVGANYSVSYVAGTLTVSTIPVTATLTAAGKTYDGTTAEPDGNMSCALTGVLAADAGNGSCTATSGTFDSANVGSRTVTATVTISGPAAGNYTLASSTATAGAAITARALTATITADSKTYDGTTSATIHPVLGTGVVSPDVVTISGTGAFDTKTAGAAKTVTSSDLAIGGADAGNYVLTSASATTLAAIAKANATIAVTGYNVTFDGEAHTATGTAAGVQGEDLSALLDLGGTTHTNAGDYPEDAWTFDGDTNYNAATGFAGDAIVKATSTTSVSCTPSVPYTGAAIQVCSAAVTGAGGLSLTPPPTYANNVNAGTATASYTFAGDGDHDASTASATFAIMKAALTVTANDKTRRAVDPNPVFDGTLTGVLGADGITATYSAASATLPGTYPIVPALVDPNSRLGNYTVTSVSGTLTVVDTDPPVVTVPASVIAEATSADGAVVTFADQVSAVDAVFGGVPATCLPASGSTFALGATTVQCTAVDGAGNLGGASFVVTVEDTTAPTLTTPDITVLATDPAGIAVSYAPMGHDLVSGDVAGTCSPTSGTVFAIGSHDVTCSATDAAGNVSATSTFTVTVLDGVAPVVTVPAAATSEATSPTGATVTFAASASDNVDETLTTSCAPASGSVFVVGDTLVTCTARDSANNVGTASFTVTVRDTTAPTLALPAVAPVVSMTPTIVVNYTATASDIVDGAVTADCTPASGSSFPVGSTLVTCTATDAHGNAATGSFTVKVNDGVAPVVTVSPSGDRTIEATSSAGAVVTFAATATDNYDSGLAVTCSPASGSVFPLGPATLVSCSATDSAGNVGSTTFSVKVVDTTPPALTVPAPITATSSVEAGGAITYAATAMDTVDGAVPVTCAPASGSTFPIGATPVHCTASDTRGNASTSDFTVTVTLLENRIGRFVAFSGDNTRLRSQVTVVTGDVGANTSREVTHAHRREGDDGDRDDITVEIGERSKMLQATSRVVGDTVGLMSGSSVYNVLDNNLINRTGHVLGSVTSPVAMPYLALPSFPTVTSGSTPVTVPKKTSYTLAPGAYGAVKVENGATLILTGGVYQVRSIDVDPQGTILFRGASEVRVATELETGSKARIILDQTVAGLRASQIVFYVMGSDANCIHNDRDDDGDDNGPASVHIGQQNVLQANIYAANGTVWLKSKTRATGAFIGLHLRVGERVTLTLDSAFR